MSDDLETQWDRVGAVLDAILDGADGSDGTDGTVVGRDERPPGVSPELRDRIRELSPDDATERAVTRLLEQMRVEGDLFDRPITEVAPGLIDDVGNAADEPSRAASGNDRIIDRYRLVSVLGRGGMGVVYRAERADDHYEKQVALKLLPVGLETREGRRRLRLERQILARLDHPCIARLLDGGVTEEGTPYLVMDLVDGRPIDQAAFEQQLSVRRRVELFIEVCDAVDYAHRNLVVHRDLKPSNCFVTSDGRIKLLDFGIGKLLDTDAEEATLLQPLTLRYASPEQLRNEPVSVASDVYALGLLLYRLLTGTSPWHERDSAGRSDLLAEIESREPPPPSQRLDESTGRRVGYAESLRSLRRGIEGDLDRIVCKALERRPTHRYRTARELAEDLGRHLDGRPVQARPITWRTHLAKFLGRHRIGAAAATLVAVLAAWSIASVVLQGQIAARERDRARAEALRAQRVTRVLTQVLQASSGDAVGSGNRTARELLVEAETEVRAQLQANPVVLASMLEVMATPHASFGNGEKALALAEEALALLNDRAPEDHLARARAKTTLASVRTGLDQTEGVEDELREALATFEAHGEGRSVDAATAHRVLGSLLLQQGRIEEAGQHADAALQRYEQHDELALVAVQKSDVAVILRAQGRHERAIELQHEVLETMQRVYGHNHPSTGSARNNLANSMMFRGRVHEAAELYRQTHAAVAELFGVDSLRTATSLANLSRALLLLGELEEAGSVARRAVELFEQLGTDNSSRLGAQMNLGSVELALGQVASAASRFEDGYQRFSARLGADHPATLRAGALLALTHIDRNRLEQAEPLLTRAAAHYRSVGLEGSTLPFGEVLIAQSQIAALRGRCADARSLLSEATEHLPGGLSENPLVDDR